MSALRSVAIVLAPILVLGTMAVGLRLGAEPAGVAALVIPAPAPMARDRLVWQVRVIREERRIREPAPGRAIEVRARRNADKTIWSGTTNEEGIAEAELAFTRIAPGDAVEVDVVAGSDLLARGTARVPEPRPSQALAPLRSTKAEGPVSISVFAPPGGVPPQLESALWILTRVPPGRVLSGVRLSAEGEAGLEIVGAPSAICSLGYASLPVRAMGLVLGLRTSATDPEGLTGSWYGALPVVPGGDEISFDPAAPKPNEPFALKIRSATTKPLVYAEIVDDAGRELATSTALAQTAGFGQATIPVKGLPAGRHFAIVSSRPEGFALGTAVARGFKIEAAPSVPSTAPACEREVEVALREPSTGDRTVAIDGFLLRREEAARIRSRGMSLAVSALVTGALLAISMLVGSLRKASPRLDVDDEATAAAITKSTTPRWLVVAILIGLSCLAYFLLAGLVLYSGN